MSTLADQDSITPTSRDRFDARDDVVYSESLVHGLDESVVRRISAYQNEPEWMLDHRLKSLEVFKTKSLPTW